MSAILDALHSGRALLMDGAMGTELQRVGLRPEECGESWNVTHPESVRAVHDSYIATGAEVLLTHTFQGHPTCLARFGLEERLEEINGNAVRLARTAAGRSRFVFGDIGPFLAPDGRTEFTPFKDLARVLTSLDGVDGILFETWSHPRILLAMEYAFHRVIGVETPLLLSLSFRRTPLGRLVTFSGHAPETFARHAERHGVAALGVNCGRDIDMDDIIEVVRRYRAVTDLPLFARPNAGTPTKQGDRWIYPHTAEAMAARLPELLEAGVNMIGGCCGTTPEHIAAFRTMIDAWNK
ncbi:MAG TPA: homocysteine S-methyltransferase family protein [Gemmataceae bacterium]|nr:homocysteine S-methyltransferase family protein [Gemmataceae bacterium]